MSAHIWRGIIEEYRSHLPVSEQTPVITLREEARRWCVPTGSAR